ncbi:DUF255 domain-containing protein [Chitinophaga oryziterrae]|uniref:DUF255 domain-containing protein n=1 Tax=Chitinophaga oryziterrae TaxID=1031224 RepID=A0A6N8JKJ5_9BACT|nr:thioredoxin family protein [Chitinophaga oryziterrae]MVT44971.1 DUF255 domain-containing protein [Chitinophaga oryziterrae]
MRYVLSLCLACFLSIPFTWHNDMQEASQIAKKENKYILLNFSGSDWCGPCIRMHQEIFSSEVFQTMAQSRLVMVNADFPRNKKNQLPALQQKKNDAMADLYNPKGLFPLTLLLNADGKVIKQWEGLPKTTPEAFSNEIENTISTHP